MYKIYTTVISFIKVVHFLKYLLLSSSDTQTYLRCINPVLWVLCGQRKPRSRAFLVSILQWIFKTTYYFVVEMSVWRGAIDPPEAPRKIYPSQSLRFVADLERVRRYFFDVILERFRNKNILSAGPWWTITSRAPLWKLELPLYAIKNQIWNIKRIVDDKYFIDDRSYDVNKTWHEHVS